MDKLSLYEILSFVVPGFLLVMLFNTYYVDVLGFESLLDMNSKIGDSVLLFCLSLFMGICIHVITFRFLKTPKLKWYEKLIFKTPQEISANNDFIKKVIPYLNKDYKETRKHKEEASQPNEAEPNLFDFAYLYLEVNDKVTPAKNFQSMYFWFINMFTIGLFLIPISFIILALTFYGNYSSKAQILSLQILIINLILIAIIIPVANWLREKLLEKVFWSYYVERVHEERKNEK